MHLLDHVLGQGGDKMITAAVHDAESRTSGEIVVRLVQAAGGSDTRAAAEAEFQQLGMAATKARNGVLLYVALNERRIEIIADVGVIAMVPQATWQFAADVVTLGFRANVPTEAIVMAVLAIGDVLAEKFPRLPDDVNELTDIPVSGARPQPEKRG